MLSKLTCKILGRRVKVLPWDDEPGMRSVGTTHGTIVHIDSYGGSDGDVWVRIDGGEHEQPFGMGQLELLP